MPETDGSAQVANPSLDAGDVGDTLSPCDTNDIEVVSVPGALEIPAAISFAVDAAEEAWERAYDNARARAGVRGEPPSDPAADRKRWYKTLEVEPGADLKTVRRAYRKALLQYHPDKFANDPEKQKVATEVTRRLTEAYNGLSRYLGG